MLYVLATIAWLNGPGQKTADGHYMVTMGPAYILHSEEACKRLRDELKPTVYSATCHPVAKTCEWPRADGTQEPDCDKH